MLIPDVSIWSDIFLIVSKESCKQLAISQSVAVYCSLLGYVVVYLVYFQER